MVRTHRRLKQECSPGLGVRAGTVGWGTVSQVGKSRVRFPMVT